MVISRSNPSRRLHRARALTLAVLLVVSSSQALAAPLFRVGGTEVEGAAVEREATEVEARVKERGKTLTPEQRGRLKSQLALSVLEEALIDFGIRDAKIKATPNEVDASLARLREGFRHDAGYRAFLAATGQTDDDVRRRMEREVLVDKLVEKHLKKKPPTLAQAEKELTDHPDRFTLPISAELRQIVLVKPKGASAPELDELRRRARGLYNKAANEPGSFSALALGHSQGPAAQQGGILGRVRKGRFGGRFDEVVFRADKGSIVGPIETDTAFHIVLVEGLFPPEPLRLVKPVPAAWAKLYSDFQESTRGPLLAALFQRAGVEMLDPEVKITADDLVKAHAPRVLPGEGPGHGAHPGKPKRGLPPKPPSGR